MRTTEGHALFSAILVLLLASVVTSMTLHAGMFAQRVSGQETRARVVGELAEAAIAQGAEFVRAHLDDAAHWRSCAALAEPTQFPCGSVDEPARRATMQYWVNSDASGDAFDARRLPVASGLIQRVGAFESLAYHAGALKSEGDGGRTAYTVVGVALLPGEGARATVVQSFLRAPVFIPNLRQPPVMARGRVDLRAPMHVVANANGGGVGVPVSAWSRGDVATSAANTCEASEFFDGGAAALEDGMAVCDTCRCPTAGGLEHDVVANDATFPCDLFAQVFGVAARIDGDGDGACETPLGPVAYVSPTTMGRVALQPDDAFLYRHAHRIVPRDADATALLRPGQATNEGAGLVWCQQHCDVAAGDQLGTPTQPVLLVADGPLRIHGRVFGLVFARNASVRLQSGAAVYGAVIADGDIEQASGDAVIVSAPDVLARLRDVIPLAHAPVDGAWRNDAVAY